MRPATTLRMTTFLIAAAVLATATPPASAGPIDGEFDAPLSIVNAYKCMYPFNTPPTDPYPPEILPDPAYFPYDPECWQETGQEWGEELECFLHPPSCDTIDVR